MPGKPSAAHRIPFEILEEILQFCIAPVIPKPDQDGLLAYKRLFMPRDTIIRSYTATVRMRDRLRRVCHAWKAKIDKVDQDHDLIVAGPNGILWPPERKLRSANRVLYLDGEMWNRIFRGDHVVDAKSMRVHDPTQMATSRYYILGSFDAHAVHQEPNNTIQVLDWESPVRYALFHVTQPAYRNIVGLRIGMLYPLHATDTFPRLFLAHLRCLFLHLVSSETPDADITRETFSRWSFPCLEIFHLTHGGDITWSSKANISSMLLAHSGTLRELAISRMDIFQPDISSLWSALTQLDLCQFRNLEDFVRGFPLLDQRITHPGRINRPPFTVLLEGVDISLGAMKNVVRAMREHSELLSRLEVRLGSSWEMLAEETEGRFHRGLDIFLRVVEDGGLVVRDVDGQSSCKVPHGSSRRRRYFLSCSP